MAELLMPDLSMYKVDAGNMLLQGARNWVELDRAKVARETEEMSLQSKRLQAAGAAAVGLLKQYETNPQDINSKVYGKAISDLVGQGILDAKTGVSFLSQAPAQGKELYQHIQNQALQAQGALEGMRTATGQFSSVDSGGSINMLRLPGMPGSGIQQMGQIERMPSPAERNAPVEGVDATGGKFLTPRQNAMPMTGGMGTPLGAPQTAPQTAPMNSGAGGSPAQASQGRAGGAAPTLPPVPSAQMKTQISPYDQGVIDTAQKYKAELTAKASAATIQKQAIEEVRDMIYGKKDENGEWILKPGGQGGGTEYKTRMAGIAQAFGVPNKIVDTIVGGDLGSTQAKQKALFQLLSNSWQDVAPGARDPSNMEWTVLTKSNPNLDTDPRGMRLMLDFLGKRADYRLKEQQAMSAWEQKKGTGVGFPEFWNTFGPARVWPNLGEK